MPSSYTHQLIAEQIAEALPENIKSRVSFMPEYFFGAQGGDVFYFYNIAGGGKNIGKYFHRKNIYGVFTSFARSAGTCDPRALSYIAGYITHYAADTVFHPYVYWLSKTEKERTGRKKDNFHALAESDFDGYFVRRYKRSGVNEYEFPVKYGDLDLKAVFPVLAEAVACGGGEIKERRFFRAAKRFFSFQNFFSDRRFRRGRTLFGAEKFLHLPHVFSGLYRRENYDLRYVNGERREWYYPAEPALTSRESADELFERSVKEGVRLICAFFIAAEGNEPLKKEDFGKHFLTGLPEDAALPFDEKGNPADQAEKGAEKKTREKNAAARHETKAHN